MWGPGRCWPNPVTAQPKVAADPAASRTAAGQGNWRPKALAEEGFLHPKAGPTRPRLPRRATIAARKAAARTAAAAADAQAEMADLASPRSAPLATRQENRVALPVAGVAAGWDRTTDCSGWTWGSLNQTRKAPLAMGHRSEHQRQARILQDRGHVGQEPRGQFTVNHPVVEAQRDGAH